MTGTIKRTTPHYGLRVPVFDAPGWGREMERNMDIIDGIMYMASGLQTAAGIWTNATGYDLGVSVIDDTDNSMWQCLVGHISASSGTMAQDRAAHPTYWVAISTVVANRGQWQTNTQYKYNDFVYDGNRIGVVTTQTYVSSASFQTDIDNNNIVVVIDMTPYIQEINDLVTSLIVQMTQAEYDAIPVPNPDTLYIIIG